MIWIMLSAIATLASLIGLAHQLYKHKEKPLTYSLLAIAFLFTISTAVLWSQNTDLTKENIHLRSAREMASSLYKSWPDPDRFDFISNGELKGISLSGLAFLEANKDIFPETYSATKTLALRDLEDPENNDLNYLAKRSKLRESAETMISTIKSLQIPEKKN